MLTDCTTGPYARRFVLSHLSDPFILPQSFRFVKNFFQSFLTFFDLWWNRSPKQKDLQRMSFCLEVPARFELANESFADSCLTTWPRYRMKCGTQCVPHYGAGDEARTRYLHLGKVALYRMSYTRIWCLRSESNQRHADFQSAALPTELQRRVEENKFSSSTLDALYGDPERTRTVDLQRDRLAC